MQSLQRHHEMLGELFVKGLTRIVENLSGRRGKHSMEEAGRCEEAEIQRKKLQRKRDA